MSTGKYVLNSYIYREEEVDKCGNNLVLCLMDIIWYMGYFSSPTFVELNICADKCAGQNNKNITIWYILFRATHFMLATQQQHSPTAIRDGAHGYKLRGDILSK